YVRSLKDELASAQARAARVGEEHTAAQAEIGALRTEAAHARDVWEGRLSEMRDSHDRNMARAREDSDRSLEHLRSQCNAAVDELMSRQSADAAAWAAQRSGLESTVAQHAAELADALAARDRVAMSAMEELRTEVLRHYTADIENLKAAHAVDMSNQ